MSKLYVQYKNDPNGTKWKVVSESNDRWYVADVCYGYSMSLPRSDYVLCSPPERWKDVTEQCRAFQWTWDKDIDDTTYYLSHDGTLVRNNNGHRIRKVQLSLGGLPQWAFIVEKREEA